MFNLEKIKNLEKKLNSKFYYDYDIYKNTWFRTGGKAKVYCIIYDEKELEIILNNIGSTKYYIIGAGSNILIRDKGYDGIILKFGKKFNDLSLKDDSLNVGAGILDTNLSKFALLNSVKNLEFYIGIPGTVGGAIKMNAGCYNNETKNILNYATIISSKGKKSILSKEKLKLSYRKSFLSNKDIVVSASYHAEIGNNDEIKNKMKKIMNMREKNQPIKSKTGGSTFKNPDGNYAAKLIEMSGCKGINVGSAYISSKHANFIINTDNASATHIEELGHKVIDKVFNKFGIKLEWEIKIIGNK